MNASTPFPQLFSPDLLGNLDQLTFSLQIRHVESEDTHPFEGWLVVVTGDPHAPGHADALDLAALRRQAGWGTAVSIERHLRSFAPQFGNTLPFDQWLQATAGDPASLWREMAIELIARRWIEVFRRGPSLAAARRLADGTGVTHDA